jgi:hypothetical protein
MALTLQRAQSRCGSFLVTAVMIAGCGAPSASQVDFEGTVQARVSATVAAATGGQIVPAAQAPPVGPTEQFGSATTPTAPAAAVPTVGAVGSVAPGADISTVVATPPAGIASAPTTTRPPPSASPVATAIPTIPLVTGSGGAAGAGPAPLRLGTHARLSRFWVTVTRYEWSFTCPSGGGRASPGAKYVLLWVAGRNDDTTSLLQPAIQWSVGGHPPLAGAPPCLPDGLSFADACPRTLAPGARCEGWLLFEVSETLELPGAVVQARATGAPVDDAPDTARWRLP